MSLSDFTMGKQLGKGAFGAVYQVTRKEDSKTYAMKIVKISSLSLKEREAALNEIRILASLQHPNIIGYKEAFFDDNSKTLNIVMEFADDGDIEKKIKENIKYHRIFDENTIWNWTIQILEGLKYLHDNKIMHRDLKCANIFLMKNGLLKLGDLNVSKITKAGMAQTQTGTPYYCSPEIWEDKPYDYKCDIWSIGCIIYEICTLRPPFRGTNLRDLYNNIKKGFYMPIGYNYSNDLKKIISLLLVVDPKNRMNTEQIINSEIIQKKINSSKNEIIFDIVEKGKNNSANLIKTIKLPRNLNDINRALPKKRYKKVESEMMENDEFEKTKKFINNNNNNNNYNNNYQPVNNYNRQLAQAREIQNQLNKEKKAEVGKYAYLNNFDNNMNMIKNNFNNYNNINNNNNNNYNNNNYNNYNNNINKVNYHLQNINKPEEKEKKDPFDYLKKEKEKRIQEEENKRQQYLNNNKNLHQNNLINYGGARNYANNNLYNNNNNNYNYYKNKDEFKQRAYENNNYIKKYEEQPKKNENNNNYNINYNKNAYEYDKNNNYYYNNHYYNKPSSVQNNRNNNIYDYKSHQNNNNNIDNNNNKKKRNRYQNLFDDENNNNNDNNNNNNNNINKRPYSRQDNIPIYNYPGNNNLYNNYYNQNHNYHNHNHNNNIINNNNNNNNNNDYDEYHKYNKYNPKKYENYQVDNQVYHYNNYNYNEQLKPAGKPTSNRPPSGWSDKERLNNRKVIYEKMNYQNYKERNKKQENINNNPYAYINKYFK